MPEATAAMEPPARIVPEVSRVEQELNGIIPVLAHGFLREIEYRGLRGRVKLQASAGDDWAVGASSDNSSGVANVIVYPREYVQHTDVGVVNARLRHEIGNLNYPIEEELSNLKAWCQRNNIAPELLTSLAQVVQEPSVDYLEMRNSHSSAPEENFRTLYETEVSTKKIAAEVTEAMPYKQALDIALLDGLASIGICSGEDVEMALSNAHPLVREVFTTQTRQQIAEAVRISDPKRKMLMVRQVLWPKFSSLVSQGVPAQGAVGEPSSEQAENPDSSALGNQPSDSAASPADNKTQTEQAGGEPEPANQQEQAEIALSELDPSQLEGAIAEVEQEISSLEKQMGGSSAGSSLATEGKEASEEMQSKEAMEQNDAEKSGSPTASSSAGSAEEDLKTGGKAQAKGAGSAASKDTTQESKAEMAEEGSTEASDTKGSDLQERLKQLKQKLEELKSQLSSALRKEDDKADSSGAQNTPGSQGSEEQPTKQDGSADITGESKDELKSQSHESFQQGGLSNQREMSDIFARPNPELLKQLHQLEEEVGSKFNETDEEGNLRTRTVGEKTVRTLETVRKEGIKTAEMAQVGQLESIKAQQREQLMRVYKEMSGLEGEALKLYTEYMEDRGDFIDEVTQFFIHRFKLDQQYEDLRNQVQGARLQRGFQRNILGKTGGKVAIRPDSFERKIIPEKPTIVWTLIIDNSGSCGGEIIEEEKKLAVALTEVAKKLHFPFEIVTFGGQDTEYLFLKTHEQDVVGRDLEKIVLLAADQGTPDVTTLDAACESMRRFTSRYTNPYAFVYFMTDGQSGSGSIQEVIEKYKRDMVITGIGLEGAAQTIKETWGKNALAVPDARKLSDLFLAKVENQIDDTFG